MERTHSFGYWLRRRRKALDLTAAELADDFPDGVYFIDLAPIRDHNLVSGALAQALGVRESGGKPLLDCLKDYLRDRRTLLLLDNFEQVLDAAPLIAGLLATAPQ